MGQRRSGLMSNRLPVSTPSWKWYRPFRSSADRWFGSKIGTPRLQAAAVAAVTLWVGGVGFVGMHYYQDTASGKLGQAREMTMAGERQRRPSTPSN